MTIVHDAWGTSWGASSAWALSWARTIDTAPVPPQLGGGFWGDDREVDPFRKKRKRKEHVPNPDRAALREMIEAAFEGRKSEPISEVMAQFRLAPEAPPQAFGVDWDALLADYDAQIKVLNAYEARLEQQRHRERRLAEVARMQRFVARQPLRRRLRRIVARLILEDEDD